MQAQTDISDVVLPTGEHIYLMDSEARTAISNLQTQISSLTAMVNSIILDSNAILDSTAS